MHLFQISAYGPSVDRPARQTQSQSSEKRFHGWRLLGVICFGLLVMAAISFAIDLMVIGPLEGRW
jgi:hypothetical protein